ncbi:MAG: hypothetical protein ACR2NU_05895 [Aeoliella sp.]
MTTRNQLASGSRPPLMHRLTTRNGVVLFTVIVVLAVGMVLLGLVMRSLVSEHLQVRLRHDDRQCHRLATAGIERAMAQLKQNENYKGEEWFIQAGDLGRQTGAKITLRVTENDHRGRELIATAEFPVGDTPHVRHTERWPLSP